MQTTNSIILQTFLFRNVKNAEQVLSAVTFSTPRFYQKNDVVFDEDKFENALGIILSGSAVALTNTDRKLPLTRFHVGNVFGAAALFGPSDSYVSRIIAETDCAIQFIGENELIQLFELNSQISVNYIRFLSDKIRYLNSKLTIFNEDNIESRLYRYLQQNMNKQCTLVQGYSMTYLAETLGIGRTSLYRALDSLESKGLIIRNQKKIEVIES